jgi:acetyltransferase-like isoleucine patch superfamily enzyme
MGLLLKFKHRFESVGRDFYMGDNCRVRRNAVSVGDHCYIGPDCVLESQVQIGNWVMIAAHVAMVGGDHLFREVGTPTICAGRDENKPIIIGDDCWIGHGAIIMHGVTIGEGAIVAAGALVTRDVEPYSIVGASPARVIAQRFEGDDRQRHAAQLARLREERARGRA